MKNIILLFQTVYIRPGVDGVRHVYFSSLVMSCTRCFSINVSKVRILRAFSGRGNRIACCPLDYDFSISLLLLSVYFPFYPWRTTMWVGRGEGRGVRIGSWCGDAFQPPPTCVYIDTIHIIFIYYIRRRCCLRWPTSLHRPRSSPT